jgi:integrase
MARPPLVLGTWGKVSRVKRGTRWVAYARFRDFDGVTRLVERQGATGRQAEDALVEHLRDRTRLHGADLTADSKIRELAAQWLEALQGQNKAPSTVQTYTRSIDSHVLKALGDVRLREATVPVVDRFLGALTKSPGPSAAKTARVVLSGMCALAVRHGAMSSNPVKDAQTVRFDKLEVKAVPVAEVPLLRQRLAAWDADTDFYGRPRTTDLADVVDMLLATGMRSGRCSRSVGLTLTCRRPSPR